MRQEHGIVTLAEVQALQRTCAAVAQRAGFILQAGSCAERMEDCSQAERVAAMARTLQAARAVLQRGRHGVPVTVVARMAGQFAKPRSAEFERTPGGTVLTFRGDNVHGEHISQRHLQPERVVRAHKHAQHAVHALRDSADCPSWAAQFFISHEALLLPYEEALVRSTGAGTWFSSSAHFLWIGARTAAPAGPHVQFLAGLTNPVGIKVGPSHDPKDVVAAIQALGSAASPSQPRAVTVITRLGALQCADRLPLIIQAVKAAGLADRVVWMVDAVHGNTRVLADGHKTRHFVDIVAEAVIAFLVHAANGTWLGGLHVECASTADDTAECLGGAAAHSEEHARAMYKSACDPRLSPAQLHEVCAICSACLEQQAQLHAQAAEDQAEPMAVLTAAAEAAAACVAAAADDLKGEVQVDPVCLALGMPAEAE